MNLPITLPFFYKKEVRSEKTPSPRRSKKSWIIIVIIFNILLAASAIIISDRLRKREYIPPEEVPAVVEIPCKNPIDAALVIDRSLSMREGGNNPPQPITDTKNAAKTFVEAINITDDPEETDQITVISFNEQATLDISLTNDATAINSTIDNISADGGTNTGLAIQIATQEITNNGRATASKAIVLLSDGVTHQSSYGTDCQPYWPTSPTECTQDAIDQAKIAKDAGITIYTIGLNFDWIAENHPGAELVAEDTLKQIASGEENYFAAPDSSDLENIYRSIAERLCDLGLISGHVFNDWDQDGTWDDEEPALVGWPLALAGGEQSQTTVTDEEGAYAFSNLLPGNYTLSITPSEGWIKTLAPATEISLTEGQNIEDLDFAFYNPNATHLTCQEEKCLPTAGGGINECATDSDCFIPPPATHKECVNEQCAAVAGAGVDECVTDSDCLIPEPTPSPSPSPTPTPGPSPAPSHRTCVNNRCLAVSGEGQDTCSTDSDCTYEAPRAHKICSNGQCLEVPGEGDSECISDYDCAAETGDSGLGGGLSTPLASPSGVPATAWVNPTLTILFISFLLVLLGVAI